MNEVRSSPDGRDDELSRGHESVQVTDYLRTGWRRLPIIVACVVAGALLGIVTATAGVASTTAFYTIQRVGSGNPIADVQGTTPPDALASAAQLIQSADVAALAAPKVQKYGAPSDLAAQLNVSPNQAGTLSIAFTDADGQKAMTVANAFGDALQAELVKQNQVALTKATADTKAQVDGIKKALPALDSQIAAASPTTAAGKSPPPPSTNLELLQAQRDALIKQYSAAYQSLQQLQALEPIGSGFTTTSPATTVAQPASGLATNKPIRGAAGAFVGLILGAAIAVLIERFGRKVWVTQDVERAFQLPVLAEIPAPRRRRERRKLAQAALVSRIRPNSPIAESYRVLRSSIALLPKAESAPAELATGLRMGDGTGTASSGGARRGPRVLLVTSPGAGDGKTSTVANLAVCMAESTNSVLVLDADLRRPGLHRYFEVQRIPGLTDALATGGLPRDLNDLTRPSSAPGVRVIPSGSPVANPADFLPLVADVAGHLHELANVVLIDTPGVAATHDAIELLPHVEAVVVVARLGHTRKDGAQHVREIMARTGAPVVGVVVLGSRPASRRRARYLQAEDGALLQRSPQLGANGSVHGVGNPAPATMSRGQRP